jgi:polyhydroxybutyrate depolymerase
MVVFLPLLLLMGLCAAAVAYFIHAPALAPPPLSAAITPGTLRQGSRTRGFLLYRPSSLAAPAPLLIVLHGSGQDGHAMRRATGYAFERLADERGFVVVYPEAYRGHWNDSRKVGQYAARAEAVDDVDYIGQLIDKLSAEQSIDARKVFVFGYSGGGHMGYRLAFEMPRRLAGLAVVAASLGTDDNLVVAATGPVPPSLIVNGSIDPVNPHGGGRASIFGFADRGMLRSSLASAQALAELNGASERPVEWLEAIFDNDPSKAERRSWSVAGQPNVVLYSIEGGGHVIPQPRGRMPRWLGLKSSAVDATRAACDFFRL